MRGIVARHAVDLIRDAGDSIMVVSLDGTILCWNRGAAALYGYTEMEALGMPVSRLIPGDGNAEAAALIEQALAADPIGATRGVDCQRVTREGGTFDAWATFTVLNGANGVPVAMAINERDVTERNVTRRTLLESVEAARRDGVAKTRFLAAASHDLRQPLQAAHLHLARLASGITEEWQTRLVEQIRCSFDVLGDVLDTVLDLSKVDSGMVVPEKRDFAVNPFLIRLRDEFAGLAAERGLDLRVVPCGATIHSDPRLLGNLVRNLLANAIRYTRRGRVLLGCRRAGQGLRVQVWDTGIGISPDQLPLVFNEFHRVEPRSDNGCGLGLSIVERMGSLLAHQIGLKSTFGRGTMAEVVVPLGGAGELPAPHAAPPGCPEASCNHVVALIDDDPVILEALSMQFELWGYGVVAGVTAEVVAERLAEITDEPTVIVADYRLSGGSTGLDAIRLVQGRLSRPARAILLTGDTSSDCTERAEALGLTVLCKPVGPEELRRALR